MVNKITDVGLSALDKWLHSKWMGFLSSVSSGLDQASVVGVLACVMLVPFVGDTPKKWGWWITGIYFVLKIILIGAGV